MSLNILVLSTSLNPQSKSAVLADAACRCLEAGGAAVTAFDLRELDIPFCDGAAAQAPAEVRMAIEAADAILIAVPIYNFDVNAAAKNLIELTGRAWNHKIVGFLCAAGGHSSYMSIMALANSMMLDFRCLIVPRFVYAPPGAVEGERIVDHDIDHRIAQLCDETVRLANALK